MRFIQNLEIRYLTVLRYYGYVFRFLAVLDIVLYRVDKFLFIDYVLIKKTLISYNKKLY